MTLPLKRHALVANAFAHSDTITASIGAMGDDGSATPIIIVVAPISVMPIAVIARTNLYIDLRVGSTCATDQGRGDQSDSH